MQEPQVVKPVQLEPMYTLDEVAAYTRLTVRTLYDYVKTGELKAAKFGKAWRVTASALDDFVKARMNVKA